MPHRPPIQLDLQLRFLITGTPPQWPEFSGATTAYREWAWHAHHRQSLRAWALVSIITMLLYLRDIEGTSQRMQIYGMIVLATMMAALTIKTAPISSPAAAKLTRHAIVLFSFLQCVVTIHMALAPEAPGKSLVLVCSWWLDVATNMIVAVPCLALADMRVKAWLAFICMHFATAVPFYITIQGYGFPLAMFKGAVIQGLSLATYTLLERPKCASFMNYINRSSKPSKVAAGSSQAALEEALGDKTAGAPATSSTPLSALGKHKQNPGLLSTPAASAAAASSSLSFLSAHQTPDQRPSQTTAATSMVLHPEHWDKEVPSYTSMLKKRNVFIKLHSHFGPEVLSKGPDMQLSTLLASRLPGTLIIGMAARSGCVVLSLNLCDSYPLPRGGHATHTNSPLDKPTQIAIQEWLQISGLQDLIDDGTVLAVQVEDTMLTCAWNLRASAWELKEHALLASFSQYSITVPSVVLSYPDPSFQQQQQQHTQLDFEVYISGMADAQLVGWQGHLQGQAMMKGSQQGGDETLQLLAHAQGRFLPIDIVQMGRKEDSRGQCVKVSVSLPQDIVSLDCCQLRLELMSKDALLCSCSTILMCSKLADEMQELKAWAGHARTQEQVSDFVEDLADWLSCQSLATSTHATSLNGNHGDGIHANLEEGTHANPDDDTSGSVPQACTNKGERSCSLLPVLMVESCRPEMLQTMAEVGLDLLQHAVSWGMVALAERILHNLLAPPFSVPFAAIASGSIPAAASGGPLRRTLLFSAQLSRDPVMLARVQEWGQRHGGPGFACGVQEGRGLDARPGAGRLEWLQSVPAAQPPAQAPMQLLLHESAAAAVAESEPGMQPGTKEGQDKQQQQQQLPRAVSPGAQHQGNLACLAPMAQALLFGFGEQGDIKESGYRSWCLLSSASLTNKCCMGVVPFFWFQAAVSLCRGLAKSALLMVLYPMPMFMALVSKTPKNREKWMFWAKITHISVYLLFGLGLLPTIVARKLALTHLDFVVEVVLYRLIEQVQLCALLLERAAFTVGMAMFYLRLGLPLPLLQALGINIASVLAGIALDLRNRRLYCHLCNSGELPGQDKKKLQ